MVGKGENSTVSQVAEYQQTIAEKLVLNSSLMLKPVQLRKTKPILKKFNKTSDVGVNADENLAVDEGVTTIEANNFA